MGSTNVIWLGVCLTWMSFKRRKPPDNSFLSSLHSGLLFLGFGRGKPLFLSALHFTSMLLACTRCLHPALSERYSCWCRLQRQAYFSHVGTKTYSVVRIIADVEGSGIYAILCKLNQSNP